MYFFEVQVNKYFLFLISGESKKDFNNFAVMPVSYFFVPLSNVNLW